MEKEELLLFLQSAGFWILKWRKAYDFDAEDRAETLLFPLSSRSVGTWCFPVPSEESFLRQEIKSRFAVLFSADFLFFKKFLVALATLPVPYPHYPAVPPPLFPTTTPRSPCACLLVFHFKMSIHSESYNLTTKDD
ncbi:hypothetical protein T07_12744 [Trichinella nelsoni]|uniref:Uncharacterized protein n=1 Tax=Trichinella nelsoni TaxID=6336 RepID=A0A0V0RHB3_9BILA|nr:hypothetical protein T07_12744 [Trichinella nelsoni]